MKVYDLMGKIYEESQSQFVTWDDVDRDTQDLFVDAWASEHRKLAVEFLEESIVDDPHIAELLIDMFNYSEGAIHRVMDNINYHLRTVKNVQLQLSYEYRQYVNGLEEDLMQDDCCEF